MPTESANRTQHASYEFGKTRRNSGLLASMRRVGSACDNAMAEGVFATLTTELVDRQPWPTRHQLEIEVFSSSKDSTALDANTPHSTTSGPTDYETLHMRHSEVSA